MRHRLPGSRRRLARLGGAFAAICALAAGAALIAGWRGASGRPAVIQTVTTGGTPQRNSIIVNGAAPGPVFDGVGAISGGGGNSRLLIDYPPRQRQQILDYLFKPRYGAALQILKVEIGGDANATDGAEPSYQHAPGQPPNCRAGYEFWLARQAQRLNPRIQVYALQWNAPHWAGGARQAAWTIADVRNVIGWLECARHDGITVSEVGGWNEHLPHGPTPAVLGWFVRLRQALDAHGFSRVKIIALDSFPHVHGPDVAKFLAGDAAFRHAVGILGYHDVCKHMALAHRCQVPAAALSSGKPIWVTEVGALTPPGGYAAMARSINNAYIEAGVTGTVEWPMLSSMPADMPAEDLGLIRASQPWSGSYQVGELTWVIAQTTEFTAAGWRYPRGGSGTLARGGSYVSYAAPGRRAWTVVAQTSDARAAQVVTVHVAGGLPATVVHVWSTDLRARGRRGWFVYRRTIRPYRGIFGYRLLPGYVYTFTTAPGPRRPGARPPRPEPMPLRYAAVPDAAGMPRELAPMDGAFQYLGTSRTVFAQTAAGMPDFWQPPGPGQPGRFPYAVLGGSTWRDYTVSAQVRFTRPGQRAGLIARYDRPSFRWPADQFKAYEFAVSTTGAWRLLRNRTSGAPVVLARGRSPALGVSRWHTLSLSAHHATLIARIDGRPVARVRSASYRQGIAGILTGGFYQVLFRQLRVSP